MSEVTRSINSLKQTRLAVFAFYFCQGLIFSTWASRIPDIKANLQMNDSVWGTMLLMLALGQAIGMGMSGFLVSKYGSKKILLFALPLCLLILLPISLSTTEYTFIPSLILYGVFSNFLNIAVNTQGIAIESMYGKSIMSSFHGGWSLGGFAGALIGLLMISCGVTPFYQSIVAIILVFIIASFYFKFLPQESKKKTSSDTEEIKKSSRKPEKFLYLLGVVAFFAMFIEGTMFDWSGIYFKEVIKVQPDFVPLGFAGFMIMMATGRFLSDKMADKWGRQKVIQVCALFSFVGLLVAVLYPNIILTTLAFMLVGLGTSSIVPMIYSIAGQKTKIPTSLALTLVASISFFGFLIGPPMIGYIAHVANLRYSFAIGAFSAIVIIVMTSRVNMFKKDK